MQNLWWSYWQRRFFSLMIVTTVVGMSLGHSTSSACIAVDGFRMAVVECKQNEEVFATGHYITWATLRRWKPGTEIDRKQLQNEKQRIKNCKNLIPIDGHYLHGAKIFHSWNVLTRISALRSLKLRPLISKSNSFGKIKFVSVFLNRGTDGVLLLTWCVLTGVLFATGWVTDITFAYSTLPVSPSIRVKQK